MSQRIYKKNNARKGATGAQYQLSELELPTKRPRGLAPPSPSNHTSVLADIMYSIEMVNIPKRFLCENILPVRFNLFLDFVVLEFFPGIICNTSFTCDFGSVNYLDCCFIQVSFTYNL